MLPNKTYTFRDKCVGTKKKKDRITVLLCSNMDGSEKVPLLTIGKSAKPRCFKNLKSLPCNYQSNSTAWMTTGIFEHFLISFDRKMASKNRKVILFVDQCAAHPKNVNLRNVKLEFFPANTTAVLQPMDQGVIKAVKQRYRRSLVAKLLNNLEHGKSFFVTFLDAIHMLASAWGNISQETIQNCFAKAGFPRVRECVEDALQCTAWEEVQRQLNIPSSFEDFVDEDNNLSPCEERNIDQICEDVAGKKSEEEEEEEILVPTCAQASECLD